MIWWALAILTVAALIAAPVLAEALRPAMRGAARATAPGQFADLPRGQTHYEWIGPADGPVIVCIHGLFVNRTNDFICCTVSGDRNNRCLGH